MSKKPHLDGHCIHERHVAYRNWLNDWDNPESYLSDYGASIVLDDSGYYVYFSSKENMVLFMLRYS